MRLSVRIEHKVSDEYGRHKENDLSDVSSKHNVGVHTVIVTTPPCTGSPSKSLSKTQNDGLSSSCRVYQRRSSKSKANFLFRR